MKKNKLFKLLLSILSGLFLAFAWPTYGIVAFVFIGFIPLLLLEKELREANAPKLKWKVFGYSYLSFFLWNFIATSWLYYASFFGMAFAVLVNSLLMSYVFYLYHLVSKRSPWLTSASFFIAVWLCFEYLHLHWEFSWPWLNLGNVFAESTEIIQWYEYTGSFGGSLWVLLTNIVLFRLIILYKNQTNKLLLIKASIQVGLLVLLPIIGSLVISSNLPKSEISADIVVVQPNIDPYSEKYYTSDKQISKLINDLSIELIDTQTDLILLPETVFASGTRFSQFQLSEAHQFSSQLITKYPQISVLGGISAYEIIQQDAIEAQSNYSQRGVWYNDYNAAFFERRNTPPSFYYKSKLVVGVENFPYQSILRPLLGDVMLDLGGTVAIKTTQEERSTFKSASEINYAPIICYESVYGEFVTGYVKNGADVLSIMTNDAWWDETQGHKQHWAYAKLRAIETRRSVARSANTGISGFIDASGKVIQQSNYNMPTALKAAVPIYTQKTFYVEHGDYIARIAQFLALFIFLFSIIKHKNVLT